nr:MAG TPA: hypothetical protein [Caudoviricetes sp.]
MYRRGRTHQITFFSTQQHLTGSERMRAAYLQGDNVPKRQNPPNYIFFNTATPHRK